MSFQTEQLNPSEKLTTQEIVFIQNLAFEASYDSSKVPIFGTPHTTGSPVEFGSGGTLVDGTSGSTSLIIGTTNSGDNQTFALAQVPTSAKYLVVMNNGIYTSDDLAFPFSVIGSNLIFTSPLPSDLSATLIKLICL